jgi:hypothetical protein
LALNTATAAIRLGFLTVLQESNGFLGGYLVTNAWGRPLEFRLSTAVQANRIQQILYGGTLASYICADLIGKTLVEKTAIAADFLFTDREPVLDLRLQLDTPLAWIAPADDPIAEDLAEVGTCVRPPEPGRGSVLCHPRHPGDVEPFRNLLERLGSALDLTDPFTRVRQALGEARKMGVTSRG